MSRSFSVFITDEKSVDISISEPALRAQNLSLQTWPSSFVMANMLHKVSVAIDPQSKIPILELGAGTGLVGLTASILWKADVILTDLAPILPALTSNVQMNADVVTARVDCGALDWASPEILSLTNGTALSAKDSKASIILAADTVYSEEHPELLTSAVTTWLAPGPSSRFIVTWAMRVAYLDQIRELWALLESKGLECVSEGREYAGENHNWDDECLCEWSVWRWKPACQGSN